MPYKDPDKARKWAREYNQRPEVKERKKHTAKKYRQRTDVKERRKQWLEKYLQRPGVKKTRDKNAKEKRDAIKNDVLSHYSKKLSNSNVPCCNCCGYTGIEFLTIDHILPKREMEKKFKSMVKTINKNISITPNEIKAGYNAKRKAHPLIQWLITNNFPKGFQILCWNCNFAKGMIGKCPHQN